MARKDENQWAASGGSTRHGDPDFFRRFGWFGSLAACSLALALTACSQATPDQQWHPAEQRSTLQRNLSPAIPAQDLDQLVADNSQFAMELFQQLRAKESNLFLSPLSISVALAMTYAGARGTTAEEIASTLHFDLGQDGLHPAFDQLTLDLAAAADQARAVDSHFDWSMTNSIWSKPDYPIEQDFLDTLALDYGTGVYEANFDVPQQAADQINRWIEQETHDRIQDMLDAEALPGPRGWCSSTPSTSTPPGPRPSTKPTPRIGPSSSSMGHR